MDLLTPFKMGDSVTVSCNLKGREGKPGKYYNQLAVWAIKKS